MPDKDVSFAEGVTPLGAGDIASGWQKTYRGRIIYKGDAALENAKEATVYDKIVNAPSYPKLLAAYKRFQRTLYRADDLYMLKKVQEKEREPWELLTAHASVMNAKSGSALTLRKLADAVFSETGLPRRPPGKFRGENGLDWDKVKPTKSTSGLSKGLSVKKVKGGYDVIHTASGNRLMPFAYTEKQLAVDFAIRAGQVADWTRPFPELQKESEKIADLIRGGKKLGMFEKVLDMPTTFPAEQVGKSKQKPLRDMTKPELKQLRVILHILPDGTLWVKEKGADSLERTVASWNPPNRPDMTEKSWVGGYVSGENVADNAKKWLDMVAKKYDLDMDEIVADSWRGGGMRHKASPYSFLTNIVTGKVKTVSGSDTTIDKTTDFQAIHDSRSPRSRESDERQSNADTIEPDDPRVEQWVKDQGRMDVRGIDTPGKKRVGSKRAKSKSKRRVGMDNPTSVRGIRR